MILGYEIIFLQGLPLCEFLKAAKWITKKLFMIFCLVIIFIRQFLLQFFKVFARFTCHWTFSSLGKYSTFVQLGQNFANDFLSSLYSLWIKIIIPKPFCMKLTNCFSKLSLFFKFCLLIKARYSFVYRSVLKRLKCQLHSTNGVRFKPCLNFATYYSSIFVYFLMIEALSASTKF